MTTNDRRYVLMISKNGTDICGWQGYVLDKKREMKHPLSYSYVDYELQGEIGYGSTAAFETRSHLVAAARRKAQHLAKVYGC